MGRKTLHEWVGQQREAYKELLLVGPEVEGEVGMHDGRTRKLTRSLVEKSLFLARNRASLVVVEGPAAGTEYVLDAESLILGRGPGVDIPFTDDSMSRQHAALDLGSEGFRVRDMGSTNGIAVNGTDVPAADLKHGDRIALGEHVLQYLIEAREQVGRYDLSGAN